MSEIAFTPNRLSPKGQRVRDGVFATSPGLLMTAGLAGLAFALHRVPGVAVLSPMILAT